MDKYKIRNSDRSMVVEDFCISTLASGVGQERNSILESVNKLLIWQSK